MSGLKILRSLLFPRLAIAKNGRGESKGSPLRFRAKTRRGVLLYAFFPLPRRRRGESCIRPSALHFWRGPKGEHTPLPLYLRGRIKEGVVFLFLLLSFSPTSAQFTLLYQKNGDSTGDELGLSVASAGDVNGDGRTDLITGVQYADPVGRVDAGSAYVYSGADGSLLYQKNGDSTGDQLGWSVAGAGDINGDGKADFIVGAPNADPGGFGLAGSAFVYSGADGSLLYQKNGLAADDRLGWSVAGAGDVNGDGKADFIIGAPEPSFQGSAYVYSGATGALLYQKNGGLGGEQLGTSVAGAGDVNGDGKADFIIGALLAGPGAAGSAFLYSGADGTLLFRKDGVVAIGFFGYSVAGAGDVNGDGKADFIVGALLADPGGRIDAGSAFVYSGATGALLLQKDGAVAGDRFGFSVAGAGDVNGDGRTDFIVGAPLADPGGLADAGSAFLYSGADGSLLFQKDGAVAVDYLGQSVSGAGDVNGDGRADIIVGAPGADPGGRSQAGSAFVYSLPAPPDPPVNLTATFLKQGTATGDQLGFSVASAGDVNGDGKADFIVGAHQANPGGLSLAGSAYVYSGATGGLLYQKNGGATGDGLGGAVAGIGDVNLDGRQDFIIGAYTADPGGLDSAGSAYVYSGTDGSLLYQKNGAAAGDIFGATIAGGGDVNGDGRADFIISAIHASPNSQFYAGSVFVYSGLDGSLLYQKDGPGQESVLGQSIDIIGDLNSDGKSEFLISAPFGVRDGHIDAGSVYIYSGATGVLLIQKDGASNGDIFGTSARGIGGDVNGDGRPDFIVGARQADPGGLFNAGSVFVYSGADGSLLYQKDGTAVNDEFGFPVAGAGDVNGDGRADFMIGAPLADPGGLTDAGLATVYSGATGSLLFLATAQPGNQVGFSVASAGDVNGDGKADVIYGAPISGLTGFAAVWAVNRPPLLAPVGNPTGTEGQLLTFTVSASDPDGFLPMLSVRDTSTGMVFADTGNGGGKLVWTPVPSQVGVHHVRFIASDGFLADTQLVTITVLADTLKSQHSGINPGDQLGSSVSGGGDVNGDGVADYIIGAPGADPVAFGEAGASTDAGSIFIYSGKNDTLIYQINGTSSGDRLGGSVGLVGDANVDGKGDFIIGAPEANGTAGAVYVYSGSTGLLLFQKNGSATGDRLGGSVGLYADVNTDGKDDFIAGAPGADPSGKTDAGSAFVYSGANGTLLYQKDGASAGDRLGGSVGMSADVNDVNGDSRGDFIIGADGTSSSSGTIYVYSGATGSLLYQKNGTAIGDRLGGSVGLTQVLDVDGDNRAEFIAGAPGTSSSSGAVYVYSGTTGSLLFQKTGSISGDRLGGSVGIQADVDGDGGADFIAGAQGTNDSAGAAFIYSGASGALIFQQNGDSTGDRLGGSVGIYADVSGLAHYIIGAPNADPNNNPDAGSAFIFQLQEKGDLNGDGILTAADVVHMLNCTFLGSSLGIDCANLSVADINCDGILTAADVVKELNGVFLGSSLDCSL